MGKQVTSGSAIEFDTFQFWEQNASSSTNQETWQEVFSRTPNPMAEGPYRLSWYFEMRVNPTGPLNSNAMGRFLVSGSVKGSANVATLHWHAFSGWDRYAASVSAQPPLSIEIQRDPDEGGNDTIEIRKMKLGVERMEE